MYPIFETQYIRYSINVHKKQCTPCVYTTDKLYRICVPHKICCIKYIDKLYTIDSMYVHNRYDVYNEPIDE